MPACLIIRFLLGFWILDFETLKPIKYLLFPSLVYFIPLPRPTTPLLPGLPPAGEAEGLGEEGEDDEGEDDEEGDGAQHDEGHCVGVHRSCGWVRTRIGLDHL